MEQILSFDRISSLISSRMKKGVKTNNFLTAEDYRAEIAKGSLFCDTWPGGLMVMLRRKGFYRLYFHISEPYPPPDEIISGAAVLELPFRPGEDAGEALEYWKSAGFALRLNRIRLQRADANAGQEIISDVPVRKAGPEDLDELAGLYEDCFDRYTGCIPDYEELSSLIGDGGIYRSGAPDGSISGFIVFTPSPARSKICHLAVREDMRGRGISKSLISYYLRNVRPKRSLVWTGEDNGPAKKAYMSFGYVPDGWRSAVLLKNS